MSLESFIDGYIECLLWSETDDDGTPLDTYYNIDSFTKKAMKEIKQDCKAFYTMHSATWASAMNDEQAGHDFCLTRNRHGAGFWDRGLGALGDELSKLSNEYGSMNVYVSRKRLHV